MQIKRWEIENCMQKSNWNEIILGFVALEAAVAVGATWAILRAAEIPLGFAIPPPPPDAPEPTPIGKFSRAPTAS